MSDTQDALVSCYGNDDFAKALRLRRSTVANQLGEPGPSPEQLQQILTIAARVPDHRCLVPFRFIRITGAGRAELGERLARIYESANEDATPSQLDRERNRFTRAPVVICVVAKLDSEHKTPVWEQTLTCGAACHNLLLAASAHGFAGQWITEWYAYDANVHRELGLSEGEQVAGFVYLGTAQTRLQERARPDMEQILSDFTLQASN
ncbi:MAG: nitroreductase [Pseudomonadota bacterium]